jgi:signal transduction histidine kinase
MEIDGTDGPAIIDFSLKPVTDDDGEVTLLIPEGRDITERKARERELERKNERLEAFTSAVSHDLKNPLSVADGSLDLYRETGREEPELVDQAADALDRMDRLIDDLLDLAEQGRVVADPEPVDLSAVVQRALTGVGSEDVEVTVEATDRAVRADEARLVQLVENLLDNAVAHAEQAARVALVDGDRLVVADDGPGVPLDERDRVFEPGYSTSSDGRGFGLAIARDIAEAHGWSLTATESRWGGARFEVEGLDSDPPGGD